MIYKFPAGQIPLIIGVRGFIAGGLPRIAPVCWTNPLRFFHAAGTLRRFFIPHV